MAVRLRAVTAEDAPEVAPEPIDSVTDAADRGTRLDMLRQMRRVIARAMDDPATSGVALAALANRALDIGREIELIERSDAEEAREREATPDEPWNASAI